MRVIEQLIDHLRLTGHLALDQLDQLRAMGLIRDEPDGPLEPADYDDYEPDYYDDDVGIVQPDAHSRADELDAIGDRLLDATQRAVRRRRRSGRRRAAATDSETIASLKRSMAQSQGSLDLVIEVARRMDAQVDADDAPRLVGSADPAALDEVLARDSLWARLWPHIEHEPILSGLERRARMRFCRVVAARGRANKSVPSRLVANPVVRRAVELVEAHRALCGAFGRVAFAVDPWRVLAELNLSANPTAYEVLVILFSARTPRHTIADLPHLAAEVGLPTLAWLKSPYFESGWGIAASIDPVAVLPFMEWCMNAWAVTPSGYLATCQRMDVKGVSYCGNWIPQSDSEWFGLSVVDSRWVRVRFTPHVDARPGQLSGYMIVDGLEYVHICADSDCKPPKWFDRREPPGRIRVSGPSNDSIWYRELSGYRGEYGKMWAAGLLEKPLLTCPKEWELT